ncbi:hypothetical protein ACFL0M_00985 [Thermodesulfobacteriota bacterium]
MRKKAERKIREAAAMLGDSNLYRLDKVREKAGLIPKVFDKTILDMNRLKTIELKAGTTEGMSPAEIGKLVRQGESIYVQFSFLDSAVEPPKREPATIDIMLPGLDSELWQQFEKNCSTREGKKAVQKILEMILDYNRSEDNPNFS